MKLKTLVAVLLVALMSGCTATAVKTEVRDGATAEQEVSRLAEERWAHLIKGDVSAAYSYLSPVYRKTVSLLIYTQRVKPGLWRSARTDSVVCERDVCKVVMKVVYDYREVKGVETPVNESWVKDGEKWWYAPLK